MILPPAADRVPVVVTSVPESEMPQAMSRLLARPFDVTSEVPVRISLFSLGDDEWVLAVVIHHIGADGSSLTPLARDLMNAYAARTNGGGGTRLGTAAGAVRGLRALAAGGPRCRR